MLELEQVPGVRRFGRAIRIPPRDGGNLARDGPRRPIAIAEVTVTVKRRKDGRWYIDIVVWRGGERVRVRKAAHAANRSEALEAERKERTKLEAGAKLVSTVPLFSTCG